jgi:amphi-Trp domain-containing protein
MSDEDDHNGEETVHETEGTRSRGAIASVLLRAASAFDRGDPVPVDEEGEVTVDPPEDPEFEVELEREGDELSLEFEVEWHEQEGDVQTGAESEESNATFELYEDSASEWRWRLVHQNGNIIADGGEGYASKAGAMNGIESVKQNASGAPVEE